MNKKIIKTDFYTELCCDECGQIIHTHFDCPMCNSEYAPTSIYGDPWYEIGNSIECELCHLMFILKNITNGRMELEFD